MTAIITRSAIRFWHGDGRREVVTLGRMRAERKEWQRKRLAHLTRPAPGWRAVRLWVAYFDQDLCGGWHAFLDGYRRDRTWVDRDNKFVIPRLMELFPLGLFDRWDDWKPEFARRFRRRNQDRKPVGVATLWERDRHLTRAIPPGNACVA